MNVITAIAAILSALGTVAAVIVALYLARRDERLRLRVVATVWAIHSPAGSQSRIGVRVTNVGRRSAQINSLTMTIGFLRKQQWFIKLDAADPETNHLPTRLEDGEQAQFTVAADEDDVMTRKTLKNLPYLSRRLAPYSMRYLVHTTAGTTFKARPRKKLRERIARLSSAKKALLSDAVENDSKLGS